LNEYLERKKKGGERKGEREREGRGERETELQYV
jgi:hypothetical protein